MGNRLSVIKSVIFVMEIEYGSVPQTFTAAIQTMLWVSVLLYRGFIALTHSIRFCLAAVFEGRLDTPRVRDK